MGSFDYLDSIVISILVVAWVARSSGLYSLLLIFLVAG